MTDQDPKSPKPIEQEIFVYSKTDDKLSDKSAVEAFKHLRTYSNEFPKLKIKLVKPTESQPYYLIFFELGEKKTLRAIAKNSLNGYGLRRAYELAMQDLLPKETTDEAHE